jgi:hypothetical protein
VLPSPSPSKLTLEEARRYILSLYASLLEREPKPDEFEYWVKFLRDGNSTESVYYRFVDSKEHKLKKAVSCCFPPGHFYSPIVDPSTVVDYITRERKTAADGLPGIEMPLAAMGIFWQRSARVISATPFPEKSSASHRFYYDNNIFTYGDAITLRAMLADLRPRSVVEIGSGFSSACMLDCADEFGLNTVFTFIDPDPNRLRQLLRPGDFERVTIIEAPVQTTELDMYTSLRRGDVLFIDSTHVLKTGSDVHFELFHILPRLHDGVVVHFHDIQYPFEYPDEWILRKNHSWNEIYALRAFLTYNSRFRIRFWGSYFAAMRPEMIRKVFPKFLVNPGGSLWIE